MITLWGKINLGLSPWFTKVKLSNEGNEEKSTYGVKCVSVGMAVVCLSVHQSMYSVVQITSDRFGEICKFRSRGSLALLSLGVGIDQ